MASATAHTAASNSSKESAFEVLSFNIGKEVYATPVLDISEVRTFETPTALPGAAPGSLGVIKLRDQIVPIFDLRIVMSLPSVPFTPQTAVVLLQPHDALTPVGIVVDSVSNVVGAKNADIHRVTLGEDNPIARCIRGVATVNDEMLILLNTLALLTLLKSGPTAEPA